MEPAHIATHRYPSPTTSARQQRRQRALAREVAAHRAKVNAEGVPAPAPPKPGVLSVKDLELLHGK